MSEANIRLECLRPANDGWLQPTGDEIREVLKLAGLSGAEAASFLGLGDAGGRTVRRWGARDTNISYANWALLCDKAGLGMIWRGR